MRIAALLSLPYVILTVWIGVHFGGLWAVGFMFTTSLLCFLGLCLIAKESPLVLLGIRGGEEAIHD